VPLHVNLHGKPGVICILPPKQVHQKPPPPEPSPSLSPMGATRASPQPHQQLFLCAHYDAAQGAGSCPRGEGCPDVHADLTNVKEYTPHVVAGPTALPNAADALRHFAADLGELEVAPPNAKDEVDHIPATACLETRALACERRPLSHCAHFRAKGVCNYGYECEFIHCLTTVASPADSQSPGEAHGAGGRRGTLPPSAVPAGEAPPPPPNRATPPPPPENGRARRRPMMAEFGNAGSPLALPTTIAAAGAGGPPDADDDDADDPRCVSTGLVRVHSIENASSPQLPPGYHHAQRYGQQRADFHSEERAHHQFGGSYGAHPGGSQSGRPGAHRASPSQQYNQAPGNGGSAAAPSAQRTGDSFSMSTSRTFGASGTRFRHEPYGGKGWISASTSFADA